MNRTHTLMIVVITIEDDDDDDEKISNIPQSNDRKTISYVEQQ